MTEPSTVDLNNNSLPTTIDTVDSVSSETKIISESTFKVISSLNGRITTALSVKLSAGNTNSNDHQKHRNAIKLDLTKTRYPKYTPEASNKVQNRRNSQNLGIINNSSGTLISGTNSNVNNSGRISPGLLADPGEELLINKIIQNHKKYSRDYLMSLKESKRALQLPVGLPNIPDLLPTSKQVIIVQTNSNAGPHKSNHHKQGHHNNYQNQSGHHGHNNNNNNNNNGHNGHNNHNYNKYYNNQHHNNHFNQNYGKK